MKAFFLFFLVQFFGWAIAVAQPTQNARAELPLVNFYTNYELLPQPDSTVFLFSYEDLFRRKDEPFFLFKFNSELVLLWQQPVTLPRGCRFLKATSENRLLYLFFETRKRDEFILVQVNRQTGRQTQTLHRLPENEAFALNSLEALRGYLFLTGQQNNRISVMHLNPAEETMRQLPAIYDQATALASLQADTLSNRMEFILSESKGMKARLQIKRLSEEGRLFSTNFLQSAEHNFLSGRLTPGDSSTKLLAGTYSLRDFRYPQGFFTGPFLTTGSQGLQFFDFTNFSHYFDHLRPGRQEKIRKKLRRFEKINKTYILRHRFLLHEMYAYGTGFIMAGEVYYPQYDGVASNRIFSGYRFSQVIMAAFNAQGNLIWENSFPLQEQQQMELSQVTIAGVAGSAFIICYPLNNAVHYKIVSGSEASTNELKTDIKTLLPGEKILNTQLYGVDHWHKNHFLAIGQQKIRSSNGTRTVLFLNRISF